MNTKAFAAAACLWVPMAAFAADDQSEKIDSLGQKIEKILATQGISFGGQFRGAFGASELSGNGYNKARRNDEQIGFTEVDFDLRARPNSTTQARAVFRMHMDDASFFGSPYTPIQTRWLSIDGSAQDGMLYYHLGNFNQKWSQLTMWSPEPGYLYTPRIFAAEQKAAMDERFLGGNARNLQGATMGLRAAVPQVRIDSFDVSLLVAKLLTTSPYGAPASEFVSQKNLSADGSMGWPSSLANFDRILLGSKGRVAFLGAFNVGANFLLNKDLKSTYGLTDTVKPIVRTTVDTIATGHSSIVLDPRGTGDYVKDSLAQNGTVYSFQAAGNVAKFIGHQNLILGFDAEYAMSSWDVYSGAKFGPVSSMDIDTSNRPNFNTTTEYGKFEPIYKAKTGGALNAGIKAGWQDARWSADLRAGYLMNDSSFRSDLAQTPVFSRVTGRIYNSDQDSAQAIHYNLFDAMNHTVYHWLAEEKNEYAKTPYDKLAYTNYVAGSSVASFGNWPAAIRSAKVSWDAAIKAVGVTQNGRDSTFSIIKKSADSTRNLAVKVRADSVALGLAPKTVAGARKYSDSALAYFQRKTDTTVNNARITAALVQNKLYNTALNGSWFDRDQQLVLPGGEASANRVGPKLGFDASILGKGVEVTGDVYLLQETKGTVLDSSTQTTAAAKAKFQFLQAGARTRLDRFFPKWNTLLNPKSPLPLEFSASFAQSTAKGGAWLDYSSSVISASAYVGIVPRLSFLAGFQNLTGDDKTEANVDRNYTNTAAGLEFKIQDGAYFLAQYNLLSTSFPGASQYDFDQNIWTTKISVSF